MGHAWWATYVPGGPHEWVAGGDVAIAVDVGAERACDRAARRDGRHHEGGGRTTTMSPDATPTTKHTDHSSTSTPTYPTFTTATNTDGARST